MRYPAMRQGCAQEPCFSCVRTLVAIAFGVQSAYPQVMDSQLIALECQSALFTTVVVTTLLGTYFWLRFGPIRCPQCRSWTFGYAGIPIGIRRMHFYCRRCNTRFSGHTRLP